MKRKSSVDDKIYIPIECKERFEKRLDHRNAIVFKADCETYSEIYFVIDEQCPLCKDEDCSGCPLKEAIGSEDFNGCMKLVSYLLDENPVFWFGTKSVHWFFKDNSKATEQLDKFRERLLKIVEYV
ncbi:MAG: hypothetical protein QXX03_05805 [Nitrososphaerota archaeon]